MRQMPADVPVHRGRVRAVFAPSRRDDAHKPYVYRGTGLDIYESAPIKRKPKRKSWAEPKPVETDRQRYARMKRVAKRKKEAEDLRLLREARKAEAQERERVRLERYNKILASKFPETPATDHEPPRRHRDRPAARPSRLAPALRPSPGWKPLKGSVLDDILAGD